MASATDNVLLGILDEEIVENTTFHTNKIGGEPDFFEGASEKPEIFCKCCQDRQVLVSQIYCPLDGSDQHRLLQIYACTATACWNKQSSWSAMRYQKRDTSYYSASDTTAAKTTSKDAIKLSVDDWGLGASDWGSGSNDDWGCGGDSWETTTNTGTCGVEQDDLDGRDSVKNVDPTDPLLMQPNTTANDESSNMNGEVQTMSCNLTHGVSVKKYDKPSDSHIQNTNQTETECTHDNIESEDFTCDQITSSLQAHSDSPESSSDIINNIDLKNASIVNYLNVSEEQTNETTEKRATNEATRTLKSFYINVFDEPSCVEDENFKHEQKLIRDYARNNNMDFENFEDSKTSGKESYEKASVKHDDRAFHHFMKRIARCPEQILRYHHDGIPLPVQKYSKDDTIPPCDNCGCPRIFELQLMPSLVGFLCFSKSGDTAVEFGTVIVYTCRQSCQPPKSANAGVIEHVIVQADPDQHLFKT